MFIVAGFIGVAGASIRQCKNKAKLPRLKAYLWLGLFLSRYLGSDLYTLIFYIHLSPCHHVDLHVEALLCDMLFFPLTENTNHQLPYPKVSDSSIGLSIGVPLKTSLEMNNFHI